MDGTPMSRATRACDLLVVGSGGTRLAAARLLEAMDAEKTAPERDERKA
jgi:D-arabinose 1-dehydrogenase-like Zn-dependent alcohol dehydrogenase